MSKPEQPFVGIRPYGVADAEIFFERQTESAMLEEMVLARRVILLYGDSGNGKSSLVNAGLVPALHKHQPGLKPERLRINPEGMHGFALDAKPLSMHGSESPFTSIFKSGDSTGTAAPSEDFVLAPDAVLQQLRARYSSPQTTDAAAAQEEQVLLIFDQFEELHTFVGGRGAFSLRGGSASPELAKLAAAQSLLTRSLIELLRAPDLPVKFLFCFREEYLVKLQTLLPDLRKASAFRLPSIQGNRIASVLAGPFQEGELFHDHAKAAFFRDHAQPIADGFDHRSGGIGQNVLTEMQVLSTELWEQDGDREKASTAAKGGAEPMAKVIDEIIEAHFKRMLDTLSANRDLGLDLLCEMVTAGGTRNIASEPSLRDQYETQVAFEAEAVRNRHPWDIIKSVLDALEENRFINRAERNGTAFYDIASEALIAWLSDVRKDRLKTLEDKRREEEAVEEQARLERLKRETDMQEELRQAKELASTHAQLRLKQVRAANKTATVLFGVLLLVVAGTLWFWWAAQTESRQRLAKIQSDAERELEATRKEANATREQSQKMASESQQKLKEYSLQRDSAQREVEGLRSELQTVRSALREVETKNSQLLVKTLDLKLQSTKDDPALQARINAVVADVRQATEDFQRVTTQATTQLTDSADKLDNLQSNLDRLGWHQGKIKTFGGSQDKARGDHLALVQSKSDVADTKVFLPEASTPPRVGDLDPKAFYIAARWDYSSTPKNWLLKNKARVRNASGKVFEAQPVDWGPALSTGAVMDISPGLADALGLKPGDTASYFIDQPSVDSNIVYRKKQGEDSTLKIFLLDGINDGQTRAIPGKQGWYVWVGKLSRRDQRTVDSCVFKATAQAPASWYAEAEVGTKIEALGGAKILKRGDIGKDAPSITFSEGGKSYTLVVTDLSTGLFKNDHVDLELREQ